MSLLVLVLWPASVFFTAVLSFRIGLWRRDIHAPRGKVVEGFEQRCDDSGPALVEDASGLKGGPAGAPEVSAEKQRGGTKPQRWPRDDMDTEILPRLQDVRPPLRRTPIRRPPWV